MCLRTRLRGLLIASRQSTSFSGKFSITTFSGFSTAIRRCARHVEVGAEVVLQQTHLGERDSPVDSHFVAEGPDRLRRVPAPAQARDGGHPGVVPAVDVSVFDQRNQAALAEYRVRDVEPGKLNLLRVVNVQLIEEPVVERACGPRIPSCRASG